MGGGRIGWVCEAVLFVMGVFLADRISMCSQCHVHYTVSM